MAASGCSSGKVPTRPSKDWVKAACPVRGIEGIISTIPGSKQGKWQQVFCRGTRTLHMHPIYFYKWVAPKVKSLEDSSLAMRVHSRKGEGSGKSSSVGDKKLPHLSKPPNKCWQGREAIRAYEKMLEDGMRPSIPMVLAALKACTSLKDLQTGMTMHAKVFKSRDDSNVLVANTLVDMYAKCGSMVHARQVFDKMTYHDVVSWTAIIMGYALGGEGELALQLFAQMHDEGCPPNARTFVAALKSCTSLAAKEEGKEVQGPLMKLVCLEKGIAIHSQAAKSGHELDIFVAATLIDMYAKCGSMVDAQGVFDKMLHPDVVSWNAIILGYAQSGDGELGLQLFAQMHDKGCAPNARTFVAALNACTSLAVKEEVQGGLVKIACLEKGIFIHSQAAKRGHELDSFVAATLVDMYAKCGSMVDARGVFDKMQHHDVVSWNAIILGYCQSGEAGLALELYACMQDEGCVPVARTFVAALKACCSLAAEEGGKQVEGKLVKQACLKKGIDIHHCHLAKNGYELDIFVANALLDMYAKCGSMVDAQGVFDRMPHHSVVSWTAMILGYAESGESKLALQLFARMQEEGCAPSRVTFVAALKACGSLAALETGRQIQVKISSAGFNSDLVLANCLVDFYGKCGSMVDAQEVFDSVTRRDLVTWNALIAGYSREGDAEHVFDLFERMQKERIQADGITFLSILTVCSHAGLVDRGKEYFQVMCSDYLITAGIEHYTCIVDLLGRANHLDEAVAMVKSMPFEPDFWIWMTVLGACQKWRNVAVGRLVFESMLRLDDKSSAPYVLMGNIYAGVGMWEERAKIQTMRRNAWISGEV